MAPLTLGKTRRKGLLQCEEEQKIYQIYSSIQADRREQNLVYPLSQQTIQVES